MGSTQRLLTGERQISLGDGLASIPERLLLAHARGEVLFIAGAGVSCQSKLPDFRQLVLSVYEKLDQPAHQVMSRISEKTKSFKDVDLGDLTHQQKAEVRRFFANEHDVALGMLERRMGPDSGASSPIREAIADSLRKEKPKPAPIHRDLIRLADRGRVAIATTNFDLLLEDAAKWGRRRIQTHTLGGIPRPSLRDSFSGVFHIHGVLDRSVFQSSDLVVTDQDFGEFYLRRRIVPDFIYDAARLFSLVLVGYSANDPPMRYLLNAVAADGTRFRDIKERYAFIETDGDVDTNAINREDWRGRGIVPIQYPRGECHKALCDTLHRWADIAEVDRNARMLKSEVARIFRNKRDDAPEADRDLFDHLVRRGDPSQRRLIVALASTCAADLSWLDGIHEALGGHPFSP